MKKEKEMSFIDHLEELRWHLIRSLVAIVVFAIIAFVSKDIVLGIILKKTYQGRYSKDNFTAIEIGGLYWHLVDLVWIYLFPLLYLA